MTGFSPLAAAPLAAMSGGASYDGDATDALACVGTPLPAQWHALTAAVQGGTTVEPDVLANLIDALHATGHVHLAAVLAGEASAGLTFFDSVMSAWHLLVAAEIATAGAAAGNAVKLAALADAMAATGLADGQLSAFAACTAAIALEGLLAQGFAAEVVESVLLADTAAAIAKLVGPLVDGVLATDSAEPALRLSAVSADSVAFAHPAEALLRANSDLADGVLLYATLRIGGTDYVGWVLNTDLKAASEHRNAPFDSFAPFKHRHYAAGADGLFRFTDSSDDDAGTQIDAWLKTFLLDFGTSKFKRVPEAYVGVKAGGDLVLKVVTRHPATGVQEEDWYEVERLPAQGPGTGVVSIGRGLKSTWWQYVLHNVDGGALGFDQLQLRPLPLDRRT